MSATDRVRAFRDALGAFATGVTVITTRTAAGADVGLTANSFNSVSLDPPMVLWSLSKGSRRLPTFMAAEHFAVHVLSASQEDLSRRFASSEADGFLDLQVERGPGGIALLSGCSARFYCRTAYRYQGGDHMIIVGEVLDFEHLEHPSLVFHRGRYARALRTERSGEAASPPSEPDSSFSQDFLIYLLSRAHHQLFLQLQRELARHRLTEEGWFVLTLLGVSDRRSLRDLQRLLAYAGKQVSHELLASLTAAGLVELDGPHAPATHVMLTGTGRSVAIELVAAAKAAEDHAQRNLGQDQIQVLKQALRRVIRDVD